MKRSDDVSEISSDSFVKFETQNDDFLEILDKENFENNKSFRSAVKYKNGDQFYGKLLDGFCQGKGKYFFSFSKNKNNVNAIEQLTNFEEYEKQNLTETEIKKVKSGQSQNWRDFFEEMYEGNFEMGQKEGFGKYFYRDGTVYEGEWREGSKEGKGNLRFPNGAWYDGEFKVGICDGKGDFFFGNGDWMKGFD